MMGNYAFNHKHRFLFTLISFASIANARHLHLFPRSQSTSTSTSWTGSSTVPQISRSTDIADDLEQIEQSIDDLPKNVLAFLQYLGTKLQGMESMMLQFLGSSAIQTPPTPTEILFTDLPALASLLPTLTDSGETLSSDFAPTPAATTSFPHTFTVGIPKDATVTKGPPAYTRASSAQPVSSIHPSLSKTSDAQLPTHLFDTTNADNIAVYSGSSPDSGATLGDLDIVCRDPSIQIINVGFLTSFFGPNGQPSTNFGFTCNGQFHDQIAIAPGLQDCYAFGRRLADCQQAGKKIFVSLEVDGIFSTTNVSKPNNSSVTTFSSKDQAIGFATTLWQLFGDNEVATGLRPFGPNLEDSFIADGFDIYIAANAIAPPWNNTPTTKDRAATPKAIRNWNTTTTDTFIPPILPYFSDFLSTLKTLYNGPNTESNPKSYYLSLSLPCTRPSILDKKALSLADIVTIRFYADPACSITGPSFAQFWSVWSQNLALLTPSETPEEVTVTFQSIRTHTIHKTAGMPEESTVTVTSTRIHTVHMTSEIDALVPDPAALISTTPLSRPVPTSGPNIISIASGPQKAPDGALASSVSHHATGARGPYLLLGLRAPTYPASDSQFSRANHTGSLAASKDSVEPMPSESRLLEAVYSTPNLIGAMIWGRVVDLQEQYFNESFVEFVSGILAAGNEVHEEKG